MEQYGTDFSPVSYDEPESVPEPLPEPAEPKRPRERKPLGNKIILIGTAVVVALVSVGITLALVPDPNEECETLPVIKGCGDATVEALVKQAKEDRDNLKDTLDEYKAKAEAADDLLNSVQGDAFTLPLDSEWNLYINKRFGFMMRLPRQYSSSSATCEVDKDGIHNISSGPVPVVPVEDRVELLVHLIPAYQYIAERQGGQTTCVQVSHDLEAIKSTEVFISADLPIEIHDGILDDKDLLSLVREQFGSSCKTAANITKGTADDPQTKQITVVGGGGDCSAEGIYKIYYNMEMGRVIMLDSGSQLPFGEWTEEMAESLMLY